MASNDEFDPQLLAARLAANRTSRRRFLGRGGAAAAALVLGPSFLAACGSKDSGGGGTTATATTADDGAKASGHLRISNWPLYMADGFVAGFQTASGLAVDYKEDFNDNEEWFAKNKEPLSRKQDIGADLVVPTQFMALRLKQLGWLNEISETRVANRKNLRPDLLNDASDPGRKYTAPYMTGMVGLAYNKAATNRPITKIDDLWDPAFKGKVSLLSDTQDGLGMIMSSQGNSPEHPTMETVQKAVDLVKEQKDKGGYDSWSASEAPGMVTFAFWVAQQILDGQPVPKAVPMGILTIDESELDKYLADTPVGGVANVEYTQAQVKEAIAAAAKQ